MKTFYLIGLTILSLVCFGCSQNNSTDQNAAQLRWGQFLLGSDQAHISLSRKGTEIYNAVLDYATITKYQKFPAGTYTLSIKSDGNEILQKKIGLGTGGIYTFCLYGIPIQGQKANQSSTNTKLHRIVEGAAANTLNSYLPQLRIMDDYFTSAKDNSKIRIVHVAPGVEPVKAVIWQSGKEGVSFSAIDYPAFSKTKTLGTGQTSVKLMLNSSDQQLNSTTLDAEPEKLYSLFVIPDKSSYLNHLLIVKGVTDKNH